MRLLLYVELLNSPDAVAKMMLTVKQGGLTVESISIHSIGDGGKLSAILALSGPEGKGEWLSRKLLNFPYFHSTRLVKLEPV